MERTLIFWEQDTHFGRYRTATGYWLWCDCWLWLLDHNRLFHGLLYRFWRWLRCWRGCCFGSRCYHLCHLLHRNGSRMLTSRFVFPQLTHLLVLHHQHTFLVALSQCELCVLVTIVRGIGQVFQCLVVVDRHATTIHIAVGQVILCLGKPFTGSPFEPHGRCGIVLVNTLTVIEGIAKVELSFLTACLGCLLIAFHSLTELLLLVIVVALLEPLVSRLPINNGNNHQSTYQYTDSLDHFFGGLK